MALGTGVYGTNQSTSVYYSITSVTANSTIVTAAKFNEISNLINNERSRRGHGTLSMPVSTLISAANFNTMRNALNVYGPSGSQAYMGYGANTSGSPNAIPVSSSVVDYPQISPPSLPAEVSAGTLITAAQINTLISSLYTAGTACTCNCNYCTCNCNYCTCNCNYACTCNCNYSDERLKENIKLLGVEAGLNIYSFNYLWDKTKTVIGVMAQEILNTQYSSAISTDKDGYYMVDYSQLPVTMRG